MSNDTKPDFCYAPGDEGSEFCGDPRNLHCSVLGDSAFWESAEGREHLVKCMGNDHLIHHAFTPKGSVVEAPDRIWLNSKPRRGTVLAVTTPVREFQTGRPLSTEYIRADLARVHQPDVQEDWKNRFDAHTKAVGKFLSEMAEIHSLDVVLGDEMDVRSVTAELLKVSREIREKMAQADVQAADVQQIIRELVEDWDANHPDDPCACVGASPDCPFPPTCTLCVAREYLRTAAVQADELEQTKRELADLTERFNLEWAKRKEAEQEIARLKSAVQADEVSRVLGELRKMFPDPDTYIRVRDSRTLHDGTERRVLIEVAMREFEGATPSEALARVREWVKEQTK